MGSSKAVREAFELVSQLPLEQRVELMELLAQGVAAATDADAPVDMDGGPGVDCTLEEYEEATRREVERRVQEMVNGQGVVDGEQSRRRRNARLEAELGPR